MTKNHLTGNCLCGAFRYRFDPADALVDYCHCKMCQRWSGAPVSAWAQIPSPQFEIVAGTVKAYRSSPIATRHFCDSCGSPIYIADPEGKSIGIMLGTVDDPSTLSPRGHGWETARVPWFHIADDLPRWPEDTPYDRIE